MKIVAMITMAMTVAMTARADEMTVYVKGFAAVPAPVLHQSQVLANEMFTRVNVKIDWHRDAPSRLQWRPIMVEIATGTPAQRAPGALAFALPYEGVHIVVFYDRIQEATQPELTPNVLAHVLVHEITHILQGTSLHSETGVMKAHWMHADFMQMRQKPLSFTEDEVQVIRGGLAWRANARTLSAGN
jgi:hypothetical protein